MEDIIKVKEILKKASVPVDIQGHGICDIVDSSDFERVAIEIVKNLTIPDVVGRSEQFTCKHPKERCTFFTGGLVTSDRSSPCDKCK